MKRRNNPLKRVCENRKRVVLLLLGTYLMGIGTGLSLQSTLYGDAVSFLWAAMAQTLSVSVETVNLLFSALLLVFVLYRDRKVLGVGTLICPVLQNLGIATIFHWTTAPDPAQWGPNLFWGLSGILLLSIGCGIFVDAKMGTSVYLGAGWIISQKRRLNYGITIILMDGTCYMLALLFQRTIALGPLAAVLISGPVIDITMHLLEAWRKRKEGIYENHIGM